MINSKLLTFVLLALSTLAAKNSFAQSDLAAEPFTVLVAGEGEYARCGPSSEFYQTDPLRHRQPLQVYMQTKDGWLGIKPLTNSFCWVPADTVKLNESEQTGMIVEDRTVVWIGTHSEQQSKHQWQVKLAEGESVTVIGQSNRQGPDGSQLWYRIVPPSGEYRWVHRDQVVIEEEGLIAGDEAITDSADTDSAEPPRTTATPELSTNTNQQDREETLADAMKRDGLIALFGFNRRQRTVDVATPPIARPSNAVGMSFAPAPVAGIVGSGLAAQPTLPNIPPTSPSVPTLNPIQQASFQQESQHPIGWQGRPAPLRSEPTAVASGVSSSTVVTPRPVPRTEASAYGSGNKKFPNGVSPNRVAEIESQVHDASIDQLSILLSKLMAREASAAETQVVVQAARRLASSSPQSADRATHLADRADQYARLAMRREATRPVNPSSSAGTLSAGSLAAPTPMANVQARLTGFQAAPASGVSVSGYLVPVYSVRTGSPPFALTDSLGRTVAYVTSSPGINLRSYINMNVTVSGRQTNHSGLDRPVIFADSAVQKN